MARAKRRRTATRRKNGRFVAKAPTARKRKRRSLKRKRPGHHKHVVRSHLRKVKGRKTRIRVKRHRSHETAMSNPRRKRAKRKSTSRRKHRHVVKSYLLKVPGRRKKTRVKKHLSYELAVANPRRKRARRSRARGRHVVKGYLLKVPGRRKRTLVRKHLSYETMAAKKRARARRRARAAREEIVMANPRRRRRRRVAKRRHSVRGHYRKVPGRRKRVLVKRHLSWEDKAKKNARRRRRARAREEIVLANPRKRTYRRRRRGKSCHTVRTHYRKIPGTNRRRRVKKHLSWEKVPQSRCYSRSRRTKAGRRRSYARRRYASRRRGYTYGRKRYYRRTPMSGRLPPASEMLLANPIGGFGEESYALENPLTRGELLLGAVTGGLGFALTDMIDRYVAVKYSTLTPGVTQQQFVEGPPGWKRMLAQVGVAAAAFTPAYFIHKPLARAAFQGAGLGAIIHLAGQLIKSYVIGKTLASNATVQQLYPDTITANAAITAAQAASGATGTVAGFFGLGRRPAVPYGLGYSDVGPRAGVGQVTGAMPGLATVTRNQNMATAFMQPTPVGLNPAPFRNNAIPVSSPASPVATYQAPNGQQYNQAGYPVPTNPPTQQYAPNGNPVPTFQGNCQPGCGPNQDTTDNQVINMMQTVTPVASAQSMSSTIQSAYQAAVDDVCNTGGGFGAGQAGLGATPRIKPHLMFPD